MSAVLSVFGEDSGTIEKLKLTIEDCIFCGGGGAVLGLGSDKVSLLDKEETTLEDLLPNDLDEFTRELVNSDSHENCWVNAW